MSKKWTESLPTLLEGFEEAAPEGLWDAVQAGLSPKRRIAAGWWYAAGGLLAAAAVVLAVFLWKPSPQGSAVPGDTLAKADIVPIGGQTDISSPADSPIDTDLSAPDRPEVPRQAQKEPKTCLSDHLGAPTNAESGQNAHVAPPPASAASGSGDANAASDAAGPEKGGAESKEAIPATEPAPNPSRPDASENRKPSRRPKKAPGRVSLQLSTGGYLAQAHAASSGYGVPSHPGMPGGFTKAGNDVNVWMLSRNRASDTESSHRQSLRLSLGVNYAFTPRWSVGTGLTYTVLRSDYSTVSGETTTNTTRHLYYLGIPLNLQWTAFRWRALSIGLNAGPLFQAAVGSRENTRSYIGDNHSENLVQNPQVKDFRWSVTAGVGVQYQLFRHGAVFLQPGFSWHLPGTGEIESYYSLHPLSFDFTFGYRFTF